MKTIGLIGGMTWRSSAEYYRIINEYTNKKLDKHHSAKIIMLSVDFEEIQQLQHQEKWNEATDIMTDAASRIEKCGADFLLICANTMHKMADEVEANIGIPLLHIADATAKEIKLKGIRKIGLLGTKFTMTQDFYKNRLIMKHRLEVVIPEQPDLETVSQIIYDELAIGEIKDSSRQKYKAVINKLADKGAEGVILGCTEIPLLIKQEDTNVPLFDTTQIHALAAVELALT